MKSFTKLETSLVLQASHHLMWHQMHNTPTRKNIKFFHTLKLRFFHLYTHFGAAWEDESLGET